MIVKLILFITVSFVISTELDYRLGNEFCGVVRELNRIYNGEIADLGEFPWMVAINYENEQGKSVGISCGGSLISDEFVLTTAVCVSSKSQRAVSVSMGEWDTTKDPDCKEFIANKHCADPVKVVGIKEAIKHPSFDIKTKLNDIALIRLNEKIKFTDYISPICLPHFGLPPLSEAKRLTATGWGITESGSPSEILRKVELPVISETSCNEKLKQLKQGVGEHQFCAGGEGAKDACPGDAGGPLIRSFNDEIKGELNWYQEGITSYGAICGAVGYPGVYTKVADYVDWITKVVLSHN